MNSNYQEWHNTTFKDTEERIALRVARWRMLELLRKESWWTLREGVKFLIISDSSFFPELVIISHSRFERLHISFQSSKVSQLSRREAPSKSLQGFTLCFQLLFLSIILLLPEFFTEALHGGSSRIPFILHLFFKFFSRSHDSPSYTLK